MNEVIRTLLSHRSFRSYQEKDVDAHQLDVIIQAVQAAPSWINGQQVSVIVVKDTERKKKLAALCGGQKHIEEAPVFLIFCLDFYRTYVASQMEDMPLHISDNIDTLLVGATDVGIALETAITAAESFGLGTVAIGGVRRNLQDVIDMLELPPYVLPVSGLCIGHPAQDLGLKPRLPQAAVCHTETYNKDLHKELEEYNETIATYNQKISQGTRTGTWTQAVATFYSKKYYQGIEEALKHQKLPFRDEK